MAEVKSRYLRANDDGDTMKRPNAKWFESKWTGAGVMLPTQSKIGQHVNSMRPESKTVLLLEIMETCMQFICGIIPSHMHQRL